MDDVMLLEEEDEFDALVLEGPSADTIPSVEEAPAPAAQPAAGVTQTPVAGVPSINGSSAGVAYPAAAPRIGYSGGYPGRFQGYTAPGGGTEQVAQIEAWRAPWKGRALLWKITPKNATR